MNRTSIGATGALESLRGRMDRWRAGCGGKRSRVPQELWNAAIEVARREGVWATSRATRLNYQGLKDRMSQASTGSGIETTSPSFIEVAMAAARTADGSSRTVIELEGRGGERLRVEVTGASGLDVVGLAHAFWRRER